MSNIVPGDRVRARQDSSLVRRHPELVDKIGVVSSIIARKRLHVRFASLNVVALDVEQDQFEAVDMIEPALPGKSNTRLRVVL